MKPPLPLVCPAMSLAPSPLSWWWMTLAQSTTNALTSAFLSQLFPSSTTLKPIPSPLNSLASPSITTAQLDLSPGLTLAMSLPSSPAFAPTIFLLQLPYGSSTPPSPPLGLTFPPSLTRPVQGVKSSRGLPPVLRAVRGRSHPDCDLRSRL
jgi:hypothetical protein